MSEPMQTRAQALYIDPAVDEMLDRDFVTTIQIPLVDDPAYATHALTLADTTGNLRYLSEWSHLRPIIVSRYEFLNRHLLLYPKAVGGLVFAPVRARVVRAIVNSSPDRLDPPGSFSQTLGLVNNSSSSLYQRDEEQPYLYRSVEGDQELDLREIANSELLYQGFSVRYQDGSLTPIEIGAPLLVYNSATVLTNSLAFATAGYIARRSEERDDASPPLHDKQYVSEEVFNYLVHLESIRSARSKRPYTLLQVHLPYETKLRSRVLKVIRDTMRGSDSMEQMRDTTVRVFCPETDYFEAFWMVHRIQLALQAEIFSDTLAGALEKPTFKFWTHPETRSRQPQSAAYPKQLKDILFPAKREFWSTFQQLQERFSAFLEPMDMTPMRLWDLLSIEQALTHVLPGNHLRVFVHVGDAHASIQNYLPIVRQKQLRDKVEMSGFVKDTPPSSVHALPFQSISDARVASLAFYTVQSQAQNYVVGQYTDPATGDTAGFFADDPWIVDLLYSSFTHTYFLKSRTGS